MSIQFRASYSDNGAIAKLKNAVEASKEEITTFIAADSNKFIPFDLGALEQSVYSASNFAEGKIIWDTVYAAKLYYGVGIHFQTLHNSLAQAMWFEAAKRKFLTKWVENAKDTIERNL